MRYVYHASKVAFGLAVALLGYGQAVEVFVVGLQLAYSALFLAGAFLAAHGLFTGVEAAVVAGNGGSEPVSESE
ncbi:hypothetical protein [Halobellus rufus]|uniref:hypothetical protein n=1 Tax=Halobellus rufus TaxID=1448860 RepID=UPI000678D3CF|nr:hypothetical protein [Halobellus rufus]